VSCLDFLLTSSSASICPERSGSANFQNATVRTHYSSAHQPPLAARPRTYLLQTGSYDVSIHPRHLSVLPTVMFYRVSDMTSRRRLRSSTSHRLDVPPVRLSTVGRQAFPVSGAIVWNDLLLHVASVPSFAVFRQRLKISLFPFLPRHYHMTRVLLLPFITTVWTPVVLAIIIII